MTSPSSIPPSSKYDETWKGKDETHNVSQKHDIELAKERLRAEVSWWWAEALR